MNKTITQGGTIVLFFFALWFSLMQINWVGIFKIDEFTDKTEEKLGELFWEVIKQSDKEIQNHFVKNSIDSIVSKICSANEIDKDFLKIHILEKDEVNAFALPNGHLVIYSGLIHNTENQEELCGVIGHEIAHIKLNHVMKKLVREVGLSVLLSMTTGSGGTETVKNAAKILSSAAFDRNLEKEADLKAVDYLLAAKINPEPFADFLYRLSLEENEYMEYFEWISTHPDSKNRAEYIINHCENNHIEYEPVLGVKTWDILKRTIKE